MNAIFATILVLWALVLPTGVVLLFSRARSVGAGLLLGWLMWTAAGSAPCGLQLQSTRPTSFSVCSPVIALGPFAFAFYQR